MSLLCQLAGGCAPVSVHAQTVCVCVCVCLGVVHAVWEQLQSSGRSCLSEPDGSQNGDIYSLGLVVSVILLCRLSALLSYRGRHLYSDHSYTVIAANQHCVLQLGISAHGASMPDSCRCARSTDSCLQAASWCSSRARGRWRTYASACATPLLQSRCAQQKQARGSRRLQPRTLMSLPHTNPREQQMNVT